MKKLLILATLLVVVRVHAAISFFDPFADATASGGTSYAADSALAVGQIPAQTNAFGVAWFCLSNTFPNNLGVPVITNDNLSYTGLGTSTGNAVYIPPQPGNMGRVSVVSGLPSSNQWYYSFMLKVTDISTLTSSTTTNFFAAFTDTTGNAKTFALRAQSYLVAKKSGTGYVLGIGKNKPSSTQIVYDTTPRNVGDTLFIVAGYDYVSANHPASLWINPTSLGTASVPAATVSITTGTDLNNPGVAGFVLGGYTNVAPPACVVDDVRVSTNWAVVTGAPEIETQPIATQSKNAGDSASMSVTAMGGSMTYQWQRNGVNVSDDGNVSGSTSVTISITSVSQATAGTYTLIVTTPSGSATSSASVLNVTDPYISSQPSSLSLSPGATATFSITAQGAAPLSYQWYNGATLLSNGGNISGATSASITVANVSVADDGSYSCYVTNGLGGVLQSSTATLSVTDPAITAQPQSVTGDYGTTATFSVTAVGSSPITYQWRHGGNNLSNGGNISGAQSATLTVGGISYTDDGNYSVVVTSPGGTATSSDATLVATEPIITGQPAAATVAAGNNATFTVTAIGAAPFTYQWKKNGSNLSDTGNVSGSQSSALTLSGVSATDGASYSVMVGDASGTNVLSSSAVLSILNPPSIVSQPASRRIVSGNKAVFAVSATGAAPLTYTWLLNGATIPGANNSSYSIANAQASDDASYSVIISNSVGSVTSSAAVLDVVSSIRVYNTNLVVLRAGDGAETQTLNGNSVFLDQYDHAGNYVSTVCIPNSGASALIEMGLDQNSSTLTGSALSHSGNNRYLVLAGYNTAAPYSANLQTTTSAAVPRAIGLVDTYGQYTLAVADTNAYSGTYFRGAASDGINNYWGVGNTGGTYYFGLDSAAATIQTAFSNLRSVDIFNGNLYTVSGAGSGTGILKWNGQPKTATAATTLFVPASVPSDIAVDSTGTNIYVGTSSGVAKWQFDGTTWSLIYTLGTGAVRYVAVDFTGANPVIYATTTDSSFNRIVTVTDTGALSTVSTFATAGVNQTFRGIRLGPVETPVSIVSSPTNETGAIGGSIVFSGVVNGDTPLTYQWFKGTTALANGPTGSGSVISGSTTANLTIANLSVADQDSYSFTVTNAHSSATSSAGTLTVIAGVSISSSPTSQTADFGGNATFSVSASGGGTVTYQWKKGASNLANGGNVSGAKSPNLTLSNVAAADAATYTVVVSNEAGSTSASASLAVNDPIITVGPAAQTAECGSNAVFTVTASGTPTLTYQWYENGSALTDGANVSGSTSASLTLVGVTSAQSGNQYNVVVTGAQSATSGAVGLTVVDTTPPVVTVNGSPSITIDCHGTFSDPGATANDSCAGSFAATPSGSVNTDVAGDYTVTYTAIDPSNNSGTALLTVHVADGVPPVVTLVGAADMTTECHQVFNDPGASANDDCAGTLSVTPSGFIDTNALGDYTLTYTAIDPSNNSNSVLRVVHVLDTIPPVVTLTGPASDTVCQGSPYSDPGATAIDACSTNLTLSTNGIVDTSALGLYTLTYTAIDPNNNSNSVMRVVSVTSCAPSIATDPQSQTINAGLDLTLMVVANGGTPTYQWYKDSVLIPDATDAVYTRTNITRADAGSYYVAVTSAEVTTNSGTAVITVIDPAINAQPQSVTGSTGGSVILSIGAGGTSLSYQWYQTLTTTPKALKDNPTPGIAGATTPTLTLSKLTASKNKGVYYCVVTNAPSGHLVSESVTVTVYDPPKVVIVSKRGINVKQGFDNTLTARVVKGGVAPAAPPLTYQWSHNGTPISGAVDSTYFVGNVQPGYEGLYSCEVRNNAPDSGTGTLQVNLVLDTKLPSLVLIKDPKDKTKATNGLAVATQANIAPEVDISGKAVDNGLLSSVWLIRTNPPLSGFTNAANFVATDMITPTTPVAGKSVQWTIHVQLADGTNTFYAQAVDSNNNTNSSKAVNYYYMGNPAAFHVVTEKSGGGTTKGITSGILSNLGKPVDGTLLDVGQVYQIKAAPTTTFVKWTDGTVDLGTSPILTFTMTNNLTLHAVFSK